MFVGRRYVIPILAGMALVSCSGNKTLSRDGLRSALLEGISLASETELFIDQLQQGRTTQAFAEGHLAYLEQEAWRSANELRQARTAGRMIAVENGRIQLNSLATMLADLKNKVGDKQGLSARRQQAAKVRTILEHAKDEI